jgi:ATP dependent DNA ligase-like protein
MARASDSATRERIAASANPLEWRPQNPRRSRIAPVIQDAILEPLWSGRRVLAHFDSQRGGGRRDAWLRMVDEAGNDATESEPAVADELARAVLTLDAVLDGYLTHQATRTGEGTSMTLRANVSPLQPILPHRADVDIVSTGFGSDVQDSAVAFVAIDLLRLDGQELLDLPLLERKRLLEGVVSARALVRVSPFARPPIGQWLASWKSAGFEGIVAKAANSRYRPGSETAEWAVYTRLR